MTHEQLNEIVKEIAAGRHYHISYDNYSDGGVGLLIQIRLLAENPAEFVYCRIEITPPAFHADFYSIESAIYWLRVEVSSRRLELEKSK